MVSMLGRPSESNIKACSHMNPVIVELLKSSFHRKEITAKVT